MPQILFFLLLILSQNIYSLDENPFREQMFWFATENEDGLGSLYFRGGARIRLFHPQGPLIEIPNENEIIHRFFIRREDRRDFDHLLNIHVGGVPAFVETLTERGIPFSRRAIEGTSLFEIFQDSRGIFASHLSRGSVRFANIKQRDLDFLTSTIIRGCSNRRLLQKMMKKRLSLCLYPNSCKPNQENRQGFPPPPPPSPVC